MKGIAAVLLAYGQTVQHLSDAQAAIREHDKTLGHIADNLGRMAAGPDEDVIGSIGDTINLFRTSKGTFMPVANLVRHMKDPDDEKKVREQLQYSLEQALTMQDLTIKYMNGYLMYLKGQAAITEARRAQDEMIAIREQTHSLKTP
jgi:hypothetical protein